MIKELRRELKSGVLLKSLGAYGYNGYLFHSGVFKGFPYESYIVSSSAAASCLGDEESRFIQVVFS